MKVWNQFWGWMNGKKSVITAILVMVVNSDYIAARITDPDLYMLIQGVVALSFIGGVGHKVMKAKTEK